jgi:acetolactate synthase-1/2/3 large subunit
VSRRSGAAVLADALLGAGADTVFCVPGESYLALLDAWYERADRVRVVTCRQEGGAATMAEAWAKLSGRLGVCAVTRGPGATNASIAVHTAAQDSSPLLLLVGQVPRAHLGREAFQELDVPAVFGPMAKWAATVDDPARIPELLGRAAATALSGRRGPVVLALPEDVLTELVDVADAPAPAVPRLVPDPAAMAALAERLAAAERPVVLAGGAGWTAAGCADLLAACEASTLPVAVSFRSQDVVDNRSPSYAGHLGIAPVPAALAGRLAEADLVVAAGPRLGDITTGGYTRIAPAGGGPALVHAFPDPGELGRVYRPELAIVADPPAFAAAFRALGPLPGAERWAAWTKAANDDYLASLEPPEVAGDGVDLAALWTWLRGRLPADAIVANGAGNFSAWAHRYHRFTSYRTQLGPTSGAMGYALPAALAAKLAHPERVVVAATGDGDFLMTGQELATAVRERLGVLVLLSDNGSYGTIRMHQELAYPGRVMATGLTNPDFAAYARAFGAHGEAVARSADVPAAVERALAATAEGRPALLAMATDPRQLSPTLRLPG